MLYRAALVLLLGAVGALVAVGAARADANFYLVLGPAADGPADPAACSPYPSVPGGFACPTLRDAVAAADAHPGQDIVYLQPGTYPLDSAIGLTTDIEVAGGNAQTTTIQAPPADRAFAVAAGVNAILYGLTITGADAGDGSGGAVNTAGETTLAFVHIGNSSADRGGGVYNTGSLLVSNSLIEGNRTISPALGGGLYNVAGGTMEVVNSTIYGNQALQGGGIYNEAGGSLQLLQTTVARNDAGGGVGGVLANGTWQSDGSLFISNIDDGNSDSNCDSTPAGTSNLEDGTTCDLPSRSDIAPDPALTYHGGQTDVLAFPSTSGAKRFVATCFSSADQRNAPRTAGATCDPGAYEEGAAAPDVAPFPIPTPVPTATPVPTPVVTPTPTPSPTPVAGKTVVAQPVSGKVRFRLPGKHTFVELTAGQAIPVGATIDTKHGTVQLTAVQKPGGKLETAKFYDGIFKLTQTRTTTDLTLNEALAPCPKRRAHASTAAKKPKTRKLWGSGHGSFRTKGRYSAATVRGTKWLVEDSCAGTLTRVAQGVVSVRDNVHHKTVTLRAGKRYLARPRR